MSTSLGVPVSCIIATLSSRISYGYPPPSATTGSADSAISVSFRGTTSSYFKLFISNLLLTIVTLGLYSPWARVRTRRHFMGHTYLGEHNIDFDANPLSILIARLIIVAVLLGLSLLAAIFDLTWHDFPLTYLALAVLLPVALVRGRAFVARHTIHRTVRFQFRREYFSSMMLFAGYGWAIVPLLYYGLRAEEIGSELAYAPQIFLFSWLAIILLPLLISMDHRIQIGQLQFGKLEFKYEGGWMRYYGAYIMALIWYMVYVIPLSTAAFFLTYLSLVGPLFMFALTIISGIIFLALLRARLTALFWDSIRMGEGGRVKSSFIWREYAHILMENYVLILLSLGLLYPWARVRAYRYVSEHLTLVFDPVTAQIMAADDDLSPLAGELTDLSDFDFDFGAV